jgi:hypothetical protein
MMDENRETVDCDEGCGALVEPETLVETRKALEHWRSHECLMGCSHGC